MDTPRRAGPPVYAVRLRRRRRIPPLRKGVYLLPNLLTSAGLFSGFYSIICTLNATRGGATRGYWLPAGGVPGGPALGAPPRGPGRPPRPPHPLPPPSAPLPRPGALRGGPPAPPLPGGAP